MHVPYMYLIKATLPYLIYLKFCISVHSTSCMVLFLLSWDPVEQYAVLHAWSLD